MGLDRGGGLSADLAEVGDRAVRVQVEFGHITGPHGRSFWRALDAGLMPDPGAVLAGECRVRREPETGAD